MSLHLPKKVPLLPGHQFSDPLVLFPYLLPLISLLERKLPQNPTILSN